MNASVTRKRLHLSLILIQLVGLLWECFSHKTESSPNINVFVYQPISLLWSCYCCFYNLLSFEWEIFGLCAKLLLNYSTKPNLNQISWNFHGKFLYGSTLQPWSSLDPTFIGMLMTLSQSKKLGLFAFFKKPIRVRTKTLPIGFKQTMLWMVQTFPY